MRQIGWLCCVAAAVALVWGCDDTGVGSSTIGQACESSADCATGEVCSDQTNVCEAMGSGDVTVNTDVDPGDATSTTSTDATSTTSTDATTTTSDTTTTVGDTSTTVGDTTTTVGDTTTTVGDTTDATDAVDTCADLDGDRVTDCAGDCDDSDPLTYPGAPEVCGDGVDNACGNAPDAGCNGLGTFVAPPPVGSDTNPGTQASPVATINQGLINAQAIGGGVDVFVAGDGIHAYVEDITMVEGVSLLGGFESTGWTNDPVANVTTITSTTASGILFPDTTTAATSIDGFVLRGNNGGGSASTLTLMPEASPIIRRNDIYGPNSGGQSIAININPADATSGATPLITANTIHLGNSAGGWGGNNGGYGIFARRTVVEIVRNRIELVSDDTIQQAMLVVNSPPTSTIESNIVRGVAPGGNIPQFAFGLRVPNSHVDVRLNDIDPGNVLDGGRGIATGGDGVTQTFVNNIAFGGNGRQRTIGFAIEYEANVPTIVPDVLVHSNFFHGGNGTGVTVGLSLGECPSAQIDIGRFFNNTIYSGTGQTAAYPVTEDHPSIDFVAFEGNALHSLTNGPLMREEGFPNGGPGCVPAGSGADVNAIANVNAMTGAGSNLADDCGIAANATVGGDFHLAAGSNCIDVGVSTELPPFDYEGDARPTGVGPDIGVDEYVP